MFAVVETGYAIPLAALIISASSFVFATIMSGRTVARSASTEWVRRLESEVELLEGKLSNCEKDIEECRQKRGELEVEVRRLSGREIELMRRILALENGK